VLSQCNTIFALRINNTQDQTSLRGTLRESSLGLLEFLPALRNAEAIAIGEGVPVPVRLCFDDLPEDARPLSGTARFSVAWVKEIDDPAFLGTVVERWRKEGG
jgi:DNA helicase HerA-like ATPase